MDWVNAPDIKEKIAKIVRRLNFDHVRTRQIVYFRSFGSKSRARARIWSLPRVWQLALGVPAHYVIEVLAERYDKLSQDEQQKTLIHELLHIPKNFSGALLPHYRKGRHLDNLVEGLFKEFRKNS